MYLFGTWAIMQYYWFCSWTFCRLGLGFFAFALCFFHVTHLWDVRQHFLTFWHNETLSGDLTSCLRCNHFWRLLVSSLMDTSRLWLAARCISATEMSLSAHSQLTRQGNVLIYIAVPAGAYPSVCIHLFVREDECDTNATISNLQLPAYLCASSCLSATSYPSSKEPVPTICQQFS